jgi:iron complex transport system permease protein
MPEAERRHRRAGVWVLALLWAVALTAGLAAGSEGFEWPRWGSAEGALRTIVLEIRLPRTLGAGLVGALLGLAGAIAQGLFRNPLADPYLLGTAAGSSVAVVAVLAAGLALSSGTPGEGALGGSLTASAQAAGLGAGEAVQVLRMLADAGIVVAAFTGALLGMALTLSLARGARHTPRLLLAGVVVGVMLMAVGDLLTTAFPEALRARQGFLLGSTAYLGWASVGWLAAGLLVALPLAWRIARVLDALALGDDGATSLGLDVGRLRMAFVALLALATGLAVSQAGLVAFVGLVAPHIVRRTVTLAHGPLLVASAATGGVLLLAADLAARTLVAPQELPVGVLTAVIGGGYLLRLLQRQERPS